jgi:RHS repeat-associated protein
MRCYTGQDGHSGQLAGSPNKSPTDLLYDGLNRVRKTILPLDRTSQRKEIVPTYNRAGALEKIDLDGTLYVRHIAYNAKGQRTLMAMGSGMMTRYAYDSVNFRLQRILSELYVESSGTYTPNGRVQLDLGYQYDLGGNIVGIRDKTPATLGAKGPGDLLKQFTYDPLKRLLTATGRESTAPAIVPAWDQNVRAHDHTATNTYTRAYEYDQVGNVVQEQHTANGNPSNSFTKTFSFPTGKPHNRITRFIVNSTSYGHTYDACGNLLTENTNRHHQWGWNDSLRYFMIQSGVGAPTVWAHYLYDAAGQRVKKVVNKTGGIQEVTVYIDGVFEHSYVKRTGSIDVNKHYNTLHVMDARSRIATVRVGTDNDDSTPAVKYNVEDHLGTSTVVLTNTGTLVNREEYYPFGETCFGAFAKKRYRYVGKEKDNETGLYYYGARCYAPWTCRFVSVDPLADKYPQIAPFNYAANNPVGDFDIDGNQNTQTETKPEVNLNDISNINNNIIDTPQKYNIDTSHIQLINKSGKKIQSSSGDSRISSGHNTVAISTSVSTSRQEDKIASGKAIQAQQNAYLETFGFPMPEWGVPKLSTPGSISQTSPVAHLSPLDRQMRSSMTAGAEAYFTITTIGGAYRAITLARGAYATSGFGGATRLALKEMAALETSGVSIGTSVASGLIVQTINYSADMSQVDAFDILVSSLLKSPMTKALLTSMIDVTQKEGVELNFMDGGNHFRIAVEFGTTYMLAQGNEYVSFEIQKSMASIDGYMLEVIRGTVLGAVENGLQIGIMNEYDKFNNNKSE